MEQLGDAVLYGFPPRSAGASLKGHAPALRLAHAPQFSPAFSGGLIEGPRSESSRAARKRVFPRVQRGPH